MDSSQRPYLRDFRYPLHLPVLIRMFPRNEMHARSENISLTGILLSSDFSMPEGSVVDVTIGVTHLPDPGILLSARGKVLRVRPKENGDFAVAIKLDEAFKLPLSKPAPPVTSDHKNKDEDEALPQPKFRTAAMAARMSRAAAWHTET